MKRTERTHRKAVAVQYDPKLPAPFLVAKGTRELADKILRLAEEHNIEIVKEMELTDMLFELEAGSFIPEELYEIIANLLVFVFEARTTK